VEEQFMRDALLIVGLLCSAAAGAAAAEGELAAAMKAAGEGNADAQVRLGLMYEKGAGVAADAGAAARWYGKAAEAGNAAAAAHLAVMCGDEARAAQEGARAVKLFRKLYLDGHPRAGFANSVWTEDDEEFPKDPRADAAYMLGESLCAGLFMGNEGLDKAEPFFQFAAARYRKSAEAGSPLACAHMGEAILAGKGAAKDEAEGRRWMATAQEGYRKAADAGSARAQYVMAMIVQRGLVTGRRDFSDAARWLKRAAEGGSVRAMESIGFVLNIDTLNDPTFTIEEKLPKTKQVTQHIHWLRMAAERGSPVGYLHMGEAYIGGEGGVVPKDAKVAIEWYRKAAECGHGRYVKSACLVLGRIYDSDKDGVARDAARAKEYFDKALAELRKEAQWGDTMAQMMIGDMYMKGQGVEKDERQGMEWLRRAAQAGNDQAAKAIQKYNVKSTGPTKP
jgi:hypothetical protein